MSGGGEDLGAADVVRLLGLEPLRGEGGFFRRTYLAAEGLAPGALPARYGGGGRQAGEGGQAGRVAGAAATAGGGGSPTGSSERLEGLAGSFSGGRRFSSAIYYLITAEDFSALHRLATDEVYHFYFGDPVELLLLGTSGRGGGGDPAGGGSRGRGGGGGGRWVRLGRDLAAGERPQVVVPRGVWQGARLKSATGSPNGAAHPIPGCGYALLGTTVSPAYDPADFELGSREALSAAFPDFAGAIATLTRGPSAPWSDESR